MFKHPKCGGQHTTVAEARACEGAGTVITRPSVTALAEASDAAKNYLSDLICGRDYRMLNLYDTGAIVSFKLKGSINSRRCSELIDLLKTCPMVVETTPTPPASQATGYAHVTPGYYAVTLSSESKLRFFRVADPKHPRPGSKFQYVDEQAGPTRYPVKPGPRKAAILAAIAKDEQAAGQRYANELGACYRCNRELTDPTSRALGIGPHCRTKD